MANALWELFVKISADSKAFQSGMDVAERATEKAARKWRALGDEMQALGTKMTLAVTVPLAAVGTYAVKTAADMDALKRGLVAVSGSTEAAEKQLVRLKEVAKLPGLGFQEALKGATNLQAAGLSASTAERALRGFGNALATVGKGRAELDGVITALSQIATKGKVSAEEINQLAERVPQIRKVMKDVFGTADTELIQKSGITAEKFIEAIITQFEKLPPVTGGLKNDFENMQDAIQQTAAKIGTALAPAVTSTLQSMEPLVVKLGELAEGFTKLPPSLQSFAVAGAVALAAGGPLLLGFGGMLKIVADLSSALWGADKAGKALAFTLRAVPYLAVAAAVAMLLNTLGDYWKAQEEGAKATRTFEDALLRLEVHLRQNGVEFGELRKQYNSGQISAAQYLTQLRSMAQALGPTSDAANATGAALNKIGEAVDKFKAIPFAEKSVEGAVLVEVMGRLRREQGAIIDQLADLRTRMVGPSPFAGMTDEMVEAIYQFTQYKAAVVEADKDLANFTAVTLDATRAQIELNEAIRNLPLSTRSAPVGIRDGWGKVLKDAQKEMGEFEKHVRRTFDSVAQRLSRNFVEWKGWKDTIISIGRDMAAGFLQIMIRQLIKPLEDAFAKLAARVAGWLGVGGNAAASAAGAGASAAGGAASSGASAATGIAGSAVTSVVGLVSGVVSAVSGVIGNFQMSGMNKSLDIIVKHTLQTANDLANLRADEWARETHLMMKLDDLWRSIINVETAVRAGGGGSGKSASYTFNNCSFGAGMTAASVRNIFDTAFLQAQAAQG